MISSLFSSIRGLVIDETPDEEPEVPQESESPARDPESTKLSNGLIGRLRALLFREFTKSTPSRPRLAPELVATILECAELFFHVAVNREDEIEQSQCDVKYLSLTVPHNISRSAIKRLVISVDSHDQGWSSFTQGRKGVLAI